MAAYVIVDIEVTDPVAYEEYRKRVGATLDQYGGKFLVRGGAVEVLEGDWSPSRIVVVEFKSVEQAKRWYTSAEYAEPLAMRKAASRGNLILVGGV